MYEGDYVVMYLYSFDCLGITGHATVALLKVELVSGGKISSVKTVIEKSVRLFMFQ